MLLHFSDASTHLHMRVCPHHHCHHYCHYHHHFWHRHFHDCNRPNKNEAATNSCKLSACALWACRCVWMCMFVGSWTRQSLSRALIKHYTLGFRCKKKPRDRPIDQPTYGWTNPLIELQFATKKSWFWCSKMCLLWGSDTRSESEHEQMSVWVGPSVHPNARHA